MNNITNGQLQCINTLIGKLRLKEQKADMISGFTNARTISSREMRTDEARELIRHLKSLDPDEKDSEKMKSYIIMMAHKMFWHLPGTKKIDIKRLDNWCVKFGYLHKKLDRHTYKELPKLVTQFEGVHKSYLNNV